MSNKYASADYVEDDPNIIGGSSYEMLEGDKVLYVSPNNK
jgi:hypothetical protein